MTAVALGLALLMVMNSFIAGIMEDSLQNSIKLRTGHVQLRAPSYSEDERSLQWGDLLLDPENLIAQAATLDEVKAATPVLWANGILATVNESAGLQVYGIDPDSPVYDPIREALVDGSFITPDDRSGILIGERLATMLGLQVGSNVSLTIVDSEGQADEAIFNIAGMFATGIPTYDESAVLMPLTKAQGLTNTNRRVSAVVLLLNDQQATAEVVAAFRNSGLQVLTWQDLNQFFIQTMQTGMAFYVLLDIIVMLIVAVIIANTLLMSVFERIREMGILSALGMKGRHLLQMMLLEAASLSIAGIVIGLGLGLAAVAYLATAGIDFGSSVASSGGDAIALGSTIYARFVPDVYVGLSLATLLITLVAALYPAWYAARLEPVAALRES
ncbi:MAG: ABC transporter permease [Chloroflexia bacterium]|nr:ABC transporter permease [Chloroflexia bacterium]